MREHNVREHNVREHNVREHNAHSDLLVNAVACGVALLPAKKARLGHFFVDTVAGIVTDPAAVPACHLESTEKQRWSKGPSSRGQVSGMEQASIA